MAVATVTYESLLRRNADRGLDPYFCGSWLGTVRSLVGVLTFEHILTQLNVFRESRATLASMDRVVVMSILVLIACIVMMVSALLTLP